VTRGAELAALSFTISYHAAAKCSSFIRKTRELRSATYSFARSLIGAIPLFSRPFSALVLDMLYICAEYCPWE